MEITALVRNSDKGAKVASQYSSIKLVYGDLNSADILTTEASKADIVVHCAHADWPSATNAIVAGLAQKQTPAYFIHTSGSGNVAYADFEAKTFGVHREKTYDDWDGIKEVTSLPKHYIHCEVDKIVLGAWEKNPNIFAAVVCPPTINGPGRGPDNQRSHQAYEMSRATLERGKGFQVEEGKNIWTEVHVHDLSEVFLALVTSALQPSGGNATWNAEGFYFVEDGEFVWGDIAQAIAKIAFDKKLIKTADIDNVSGEEADKLTKSGSYLWGTNSRVKAIRANKLFGWTPKGTKLKDLLPSIVEGEAKALGLIKSHAEKASG